MNSQKKQLIVRMASWSGAVLALALLVGGAALGLLQADRRHWEDEQKAERAQAVDRARKYLGEVAKRIVKLPVDATLVGEIESRYFDEQAGGPMHVWAMGTAGELLFGVPRETFSRQACGRWWISTGAIGSAGVLGRTSPRSLSRRGRARTK